MPPSADDVPGRTPPSRQQRRGGAGSAQARRAARLAGSAMCWAEPDEVIDYHPQGLCGCGADLGSALDLGVARSHQQLEIPEPPAPAHHLVQIGL